MKSGLLAAVLAVAWYGGARAGAATAPELGVYAGTGRACAGPLKITATRIVWNTPFSQCRGSSYTVLDRRATGSTQVTFQLIKPKPACRYSILTLTHEAAAGPAIGWAVVGFPTLADYQAQNLETGLSCYLVK